MTEANRLKKGDVVRVTGKAGSVYGRVLQTARPEELPDISGPKIPPVELVVQTLAELDIDQLALILHNHGGHEVAFFALHTRAGEWRDLQAELLTIQISSPQQQGTEK